MAKPEDWPKVREAIARFEADNDLVRGTAWADSQDRPEGGQSWEGRARMAAARLAAGSRLDPLDREALDRYQQD